MKLTVPVVRTKIIIPRRRTEILSRPRLLSILDNVLDLKLIILAAPAGYGKTSLLIDFAYHTQLPVCWFAIDALDEDPQRFIAHFISAIANSFPSFGEASVAALSNLDLDSMKLEPVISAIVNDVYDHITEHFVFVLDDYHFVRDCKLIDEFINRIVLEMSENCHLVISSRTLLTLPDLTLLVARSQVAGLSYEELAFLPEEIKQLYSMNYHQKISEETASDLVVQTEGWITGLLLSAQLSPKVMSNRLRLARVSGIGLYEYLAQQVLEQQSEELTLFLKRTSLLDEFDAKLCDEIFSQIPAIRPQNWQALIDQLLHENLFVLPVDDETTHLRYHHLFRDFLQSCIRTERPFESRQIELQLAEHYEREKEWERAFATLSCIGDIDRLVGVILRAAPTMILGGRITTLSTWLEVVPEQTRKNRPEILSIDGTILMLRGDTKASLQLLNQAIAGLENHPDRIELARALIRRSSLHRNFGSYDKEKADAEEALKICASAPGMEKLEAEAARAVGLVFFHTGEIKNALNYLTSSLEKYSLLGEEMDAAKVLLDLGVVHLTLGQLDQAENAYQKSLDYWQITQNSLWQANLHNNIGIVQHLRGLHEEAAVSFEKAIHHARLATNPRLEGFALTSLGDLFRDIRALPEARRAYELAHEAAKFGDDQALKVYLSLSEAALERLTGNFSPSEDHLNDALKIAMKGGSKYEINLCNLELCCKQLIQKNFTDLPVRLKELTDYFKAEGFHIEGLRARYLHCLVTALSEPSRKASARLEDLISAGLSGSDRFSFIQFAYETVDLLAEYFKSTKSAALSGYIQELREFESSLVALRKTIRRRSETVQFSSPKFVIRAFGKCQVKIGDHIVTLSEWKTQIVRDLFFYILLHHEGVTKEEIGEAFWPESTIDSLKVRFKNSIYRLRHALGSDSISFNDDYYRFNRSFEYDFDAENFIQYINLAQNSPEITEKIHNYRQAVNLYRGSFLPKIDYDWVLVQREQFNRMFVTAISELMKLLLHNNQPQLVIHFADRALEEDSCFEEGYRMAMRAFSVMGDRAAVSRYYEKCISNLKKEMDLEPSVQTTELYQTLIQ